MGTGGATGTGGACDSGKPFGAPAALDALNSTASDEYIFVSADRLTGYLSSNRPGGAGDYDIWIATRATPSDVFGVPSPLGGPVDTAVEDLRPVLSKDGLRLFYATLVAGASDDIWVATRSSTLTVFSAGAPVAGLNTSGLENAPWLSGDETLIYFHSTRAGGLGGADISVADLGTNGVSNARNLAGVNTTLNEENPVLTPDGLRIFFASTQSGGAAMGNYDIWTAQRTTTADGFGQPVNVAELNSSANDLPNWISPDGCTLYFTSSRANANSFHIYQATRGR